MVDDDRRERQVALAPPAVGVDDAGRAALAPVVVDENDRWAWNGVGWLGLQSAESSAAALKMTPIDSPMAAPATAPAGRK